MTATPYRDLSEAAPIRASEDFGANLSTIKGIEKTAGVDLLVHRVEVTQRFVYDRRAGDSIQRDFIRLVLSPMDKPEKMATFHSWSRNVINRLKPLAQNTGENLLNPPVKINVRSETVGDPDNGYKALLVR